MVDSGSCKITINQEGSQKRLANGGDIDLSKKENQRKIDVDHCMTISKDKINALLEPFTQLSYQYWMYSN